MSQTEKYTDGWNKLEAHRVWRVNEIIAAFQKLPFVTALDPTGILDIGSGIGSVIQANKLQFPDAAVTAVDIDARAEQAALAVGARDFLLQNILETEVVRMLELLVEREITLITALQTSPAIAEYLMRLIIRSDQELTVLMSIVMESEDSLGRTRFTKLPLQLLLQAVRVGKFTLHEGRDFTEPGIWMRKVL